MANTFTNQAALTYNGTTVLSNIAVGVMESSLSLTKNAVADEYGADDTVTYVISIVNTADAAVTGLTVTDDLGAYAFGADTVQPLSYVDGSAQYYANGVRQADPSVSTADGLVFGNITVPAQGNAAIIYSAQINAFAPLDAGSEITNTVSVADVEKMVVQAQSTVPAAESADVSVVKSVSPIPVAENGQLTYTMQLSNIGNLAVTETDGAVISDTFDPLLTGISVELNGQPLAADAYSYNELTGVFATTAGAVTVPAATYTQDQSTGEWTTVPGTATLTVTGAVGAL